MTRHIGFVVSALVLLTSGTAVAQDKQRACALLTVEEVAGVAGAPAERSLEHDEVISEGPWKGETQRRCNWPLGRDGRNGNVYLLVTDIRTDAQRQASTGVLDKPTDQFKAQGWAVAQKTVGNARCVVGVPPPSQKTVTVAVTCVMEARGSSLSMGAVLAAGTVTPEQLKALLDKALRRLS
jgi:hypothetical protein